MTKPRTEADAGLDFVGGFYGNHFPELEEIGLSTVKEELKNDCLPEHLVEAARMWLKLKAQDRVVA